MASRYPHDETCALRTAELRTARFAFESRGLKWKKIAAVVGAVLSTSVFGAAYVKLGNKWTFDGEATMSLEAKREQLQGSAMLEQPSFASGLIAPPPEPLVPFVFGGLGAVIFTEPPEEKPLHTVVEAPRVGEILSDPQPGPPAGQDIAFVPNGPETMKSMLRQAFGLGENHNSGESVKPTSPAEALRIDELDPEVKAITAEVKAELRQALLKMLGSKKEVKEPAVHNVISDHTQGWNWLHPVVETYSRVKDPDSDVVSVPAVYQFLQSEGATRTKTLKLELLRVEAEYQQTLQCFMQGANNRNNLSRDEYEKVVQWMNEACAKAKEVSKDEEGFPASISMTKAEFKALIAKHFESVLATFNTTRFAALRHALETKHELAKLQTCINQATDKAMDNSTDVVHDAVLVESLDWILHTCIDQ